MKNLWLLPILLFLSCRNNEPRDIEIEAPVVTTTLVVKGDISIPVVATGRITTKDEIKLSFKQGGVIESVLVDEGDRAVKGQLLARLRQTEFISSRTQAELAFEKAQRDYERTVNLYNDSVATLEQLQNATTVLEFARQTLESVKFNVGYTEIRAPANGRILKKLASPEEITSAGMPVLLFGSTDSKWILTVAVSDRDVVRLVAGDSAVVMTDALQGKKLKAVVAEISAMADPYTGTFDIELLIVENEKMLSTGMIATANIYPSETSGFWLVPAQSLLEGNGKEAWVFVVTDGKASKLKINVEAVRGGNLYATGFPRDSAEVITSGQGVLSEGMAVRTETAR